ncbi:type II restriction endonuclease [Hafnia alvei]|uniref:type II restriction endonuclease n=1 Tax=Hafnia alvei TaxID=569 RepID=UPI0024A945F3|nr:type II restriction endonuclease [Hafnia alvei]
MDNRIENLIRLPEQEEKKFADFIRKHRGELISSPKITAAKATENNSDFILGLIHNGFITRAIIELRELAYDEFLKEESVFNAYVLKEIGRNFDAPKHKLDELCKILSETDTASFPKLKDNVAELFGRYSGFISPYIYQLCLSNTQSRRSRAGKTFEGIIYFLYEHFKYSYASQASIGKKTFSDLGLGKVVDSILPSIDAFNQRRDKTIVGTMKTTLRERWQEVVEEVARSNLPNIHLLTVDESIAASKAEQMAKHNIVLVVRNDVKNRDEMKNRRSIIDFETYFLNELPETLKFWS